ncbi:hypothetical protein KY285_006786 [Solanum tuberosum]|nr:hypothetical protein KY289_009354 [Solanum tuberosum]KAH0716044.1 hypothetical protein KY284_008949 [Solanum tuberosum]KAH0745129.1 hypothetical protein KY285_006786 [Solanum tuberosum]
MVAAQLLSRLLAVVCTGRSGWRCCCWSWCHLALASCWPERASPEQVRDKREGVAGLLGEERKR